MTTENQKSPVAPQGEYPPLPEATAYGNRDELDNMLDDRSATVHGKADGWRGTPLFDAAALRAYFDLGRQPAAAPALEAPAAPEQLEAWWAAELAAAPQAPAAPSADYVLVDEGGPVELAGAQAQYSIEREDGSTAAWILGDGSAVAELMAALRMPVSDAAQAAPAAPAVDATSDTALLDAMERERIAVIPEFEGPWDAQIFGEDEAALACGSGATPREAITEALASLDARKAHDAAQDKEGGDQ